MKRKRLVIDLDVLVCELTVGSRMEILKGIPQGAVLKDVTVGDTNGYKELFLDVEHDSFEDIDENRAEGVPLIIMEIEGVLKV